MCGVTSHPTAHPLGFVCSTFKLTFAIVREAACMGKCFQNIIFCPRCFSIILGSDGTFYWKYSHVSEQRDHVKGTAEPVDPMVVGWLLSRPWEYI